MSTYLVTEERFPGREQPLVFGVYEELSQCPPTGRVWDLIDVAELASRCGLGSVLRFTDDRADRLSITVTDGDTVTVTRARDGVVWLRGFVLGYVYRTLRETR